MPQTKFMLKCPECNGQNYVTSKNRTNVTEKLILSKYCPVCRKHTKHEEARLRK
ncbi:MAG TPA: 50S ribosomal protein L33 [Armatimonadota bacterium]|jgi:large subunit ribosomal protein L33